MDKPPTRNLSSLEWESLIDDFHFGGPRRHRWTSQFTSLSLLFDLSLSSLLKKDFPSSLKLNLLIFLQEFSSLLISPDSADPRPSISKLVETLRLLIQSPIDGVSVTFSLKEQILVSATSIVATLTDSDDIGGGFGGILAELESLVAILIAVINRPNHGVDRQTRAVACECLRVLEERFPGLLSEIIGHLWALCQSERSHASQSYLLLLLQVIHHIVDKKLSVNSIVSTSVPLVPFNVPQWMKSGSIGGGGELSGSNSKDLKRVLSFLLEWTQVLTPCGVVEFMSMVMPLAIALELQVSLLRVQFSGLLYTFNPLLNHLVLVMYLDFMGTFEGQEGEITKRLLLISKERQHRLVFQLLSLHWLLGIFGKIVDNDEGSRLVSGIRSYIYPNVFDPLALKSLKLDLLGLCYFSLDSRRNRGSGEPVYEGKDVDVFVKYFGECLVSVSGFKWLPPWSTETAVAFRAIVKFIVGGSFHSLATDSSISKTLMDSTMVRKIKTMLVNMILGYRKLVPLVVALIDRLLQCQNHSFLGDNLLQTFDEHLLPKVTVDYKLTSYFPLIDRICQSTTISPKHLVELLTKFMVFLVDKHGPDSGLKSWSQGSRVLGICRTMLMHQHSSRLFIPLSRLLAFTTLHFPDVEVRDNARVYLRLLICVPGKKLRQILNSGEQLMGVSPSPHASSFFNVLSPRHSQSLRKSKRLSLYIHLERVVPLLVKQSWSLSLPALSLREEKSVHNEVVKESDAEIIEKEDDDHDRIEFVTESRRIEQPPEPLRVMDSKITRILEILRKHFSCIPDFRHMQGLKIRISCTLRFESEPFKRSWGANFTGINHNKNDALPAIYATVLTFSTSAPYGAMPSCHIPFLFGEPTTNDDHSSNKETLDIVPVEVEFESTEKQSYKAPVIIELEPREPVPGLIDVVLESNAESGQIIHGKLQGIPVGIEDMFLRTVVPPDFPDDLIPNYCSDLFDALWEACDTSSNTGREVFTLKNGKGVATIYGTRSVKLLELPSTFVVHAVEQHLEPFVVSVIGEPLMTFVKDRGIIRNTTWKEFSTDSALGSNDLISDFDDRPLYLTYVNEADDADGRNLVKTNMGCIHVLIFLPPRYHLLFQMEVSDISTLVRIRTDHWPSLAYIDDYLEALFRS